MFPMKGMPLPKAKLGAKVTPPLPMKGKGKKPMPKMKKQMPDAQGGVLSQAQFGGPPK